MINVPSISHDVPSSRPNIGDPSIVTAENKRIEDRIITSEKEIGDLIIECAKIGELSDFDASRVAVGGQRPSLQDCFHQSPARRLIGRCQGSPRVIAKALGVFQGSKFFTERDTDIGVGPHRDLATLLEPSHAIKNSVAEIRFGDGTEPAMTPDRASASVS